MNPLCLDDLTCKQLFNHEHIRSFSHSCPSDASCTRRTDESHTARYVHTCLIRDCNDNSLLHKARFTHRDGGIQRQPQLQQNFMNDNSTRNNHPNSNSYYNHNSNRNYNNNTRNHHNLAQYQGGKRVCHFGDKCFKRDDPSHLAMFAHPLVPQPSHHQQQPPPHQFQPQLQYQPQKQSCDLGYACKDNTPAHRALFAHPREFVPFSVQQFYMQQQQQQQQLQQQQLQQQPQQQQAQPNLYVFSPNSFYPTAVSTTGVLSELSSQMTQPLPDGDINQDYLEDHDGEFLQDMNDFLREQGIFCCPISPPSPPPTIPPLMEQWWWEGNLW
eukprot:TRINITY_DN1096_c0_g1_i16.p1 TRINITY_DN1096_c0_g1~~TRINITY_DN1096_c0_g1_i16.p1  ORF type:complete len:327 (-),score=68.10 TRINITY_DN1096_c0_g1_i16:153-1133(-)